jgi:hypothetical protein
MYPWLVSLHLLGLVVFLASHGVAMYVAFRVRSERDRSVIAALLGLSTRGNQVMYLGLLALGIGGLGAAATSDALTAPWNVASYIVLAAVVVGMMGIAAPYYYPLREALDGTDKTPRLDDDALATRLRTRRPEVLALVGGTGLAVLTLLMAVKPALW